MIRNIIVLIVLAGMVIAGWTVADNKGVLDGKTFAGEAGEKGNTSNEKDELIFADGKFRSAGCDQYGFAPAPYKTTTEEGAVHFEAESTSEKEGKIHWKGWVKGDACEATYVWSKPGQKDIEYWFKGTLKKPAQ